MLVFSISLLSCSKEIEKKIDKSFTVYTIKLPATVGRPYQYQDSDKKQTFFSAKPFGYSSQKLKEVQSTAQSQRFAPHLILPQRTQAHPPPFSIFSKS